MIKNKKFIILAVVLSVLFFGLGGYVVFNYFFNDQEDIENKDDNKEDNGDIENNISDEEKNIFTDYCSALGWIAYVSSFGNNNEIKKDFDFFNDNYYKELFVMEYINARDGNQKFINVVSDENPAYGLDLYLYDDFNIDYFNVFGENYNKDNLKIVDNKEYVIYSNRHHGSNGVYAKNINIIDTVIEDNVYVSSVEIIYSEDTKMIANIEKINAIIRYIKDGEKIIFKSFIVNNQI